MEPGGDRERSRAAEGWPSPRRSRSARRRSPPVGTATIRRGPPQRGTDEHVDREDPFQQGRPGKARRTRRRRRATHADCAFARWLTGDVVGALFEPHAARAGAAPRGGRDRPVQAAGAAGGGGRAAALAVRQGLQGGAGEADRRDAPRRSVLTGPDAARDGWGWAYYELHT